MQRVMNTIFYLFILLYATLLASEVKVVEPNEAIRLIGNRSVIFVSADDNKSHITDNIVGSVNINAKDIRYRDHNGSILCLPKYICLKDAKSVIEDRGIKETQAIIVYDQFDGVNASGLYSFFEAMGHKDIKILNGGLESIRLLDPNQKLYDKLQKEYDDINTTLSDTEQELDSEDMENLLSDMNNITAKMDIIKPSLLTHNTLEKREQEKSYKPKEQRVNLTYIASTQEIQRAINDINKTKDASQFVIIDTRSKKEIEEGHIPHSIAIESKNFSNFIDKKSFKSIQEMQQIVDKFGIEKEKTIYTYSNNSAGRGSHVALALRIIGYSKVKVFAGGWSSWSDNNQTQQD